MHTRLLLTLNIFSLILYYYEALETFRDPKVQGKVVGSGRTIEEDIERLNAKVR